MRLSYAKSAIYPFQELSNRCNIPASRTSFARSPARRCGRTPAQADRPNQLGCRIVQMQPNGCAAVAQDQRQQQCRAYMHSGVPISAAFATPLSAAPQRLCRIGKLASRASQLLRWRGCTDRDRIQCARQRTDGGLGGVIEVMTMRQPAGIVVGDPGHTFGILPDQHF
jgi:hypothetical protein